MAFNVVDSRGNHLGYVARDFIDEDLHSRAVLVALSSSRIEMEWLDLKGVQTILTRQLSNNPWQANMDETLTRLRSLVRDEAGATGFQVHQESDLWRFMLLRRINQISDYIKPKDNTVRGYLGLNRESLVFDGDNNLVIAEELSSLQILQVMETPPLYCQVRGIPEVVLSQPGILPVTSWQGFFQRDTLTSTKIPLVSGNVFWTLHLPLLVQARNKMDVLVSLEESILYCDGVLYRCERNNALGLGFRNL